MFSGNLPKKKLNSPKKVGSSSSSSDSNSNSNDENIKSKKVLAQLDQLSKLSKKPAVPPPNAVITPPNADWRSAINRENAPNSPSATSRKPKILEEMSALTEIDLDYDDFELAMMEEEMAGYDLKSEFQRTVVGKTSAIPVERQGLDSGMRISETVWENVKDSEGNPYKFRKVHQDQFDLVVVYADPRETTSEFRTVLEEFKRLPVSTLGIGLAAINCDNPNEHRKFLKKNALKFPLLSDTSKTFMSIAHCVGTRRLVSALIILESKTNEIVKIWYENEFDVVTTKNLLVQEIEKYRRDHKKP